MRIMALIPAYNESGKIGLVVAKVPRDQVEAIVVVSDGSRDNTADEARRAGAIVLEHAINKGVGAAIRTGMLYGREHGFKAVVIMGGDDQDNPEEMHRLLDKLRDGYDFVQGSRYLPGGETVNIPWFRWITTGFYSFLFKVLIQYPVTDGTNGFRAYRLAIMDHPAVDVHQRWLDTYELEPYLYYQSIKQGFRVTEAPVTKRYPIGKKGFTKMIPIIDWWRILRPLLYLRLGLKR
ncbi:glycosyltransferase family 2 protein [bacterium]|nr:glycosyltransferase family 2 protein [candidate division CSSED10-310 bacterium]